MCDFISKNKVSEDDIKNLEEIIDSYIKKIDKMIDNWEKYIKTHPEEIGVHTNCEGLKYIRNELKKERDNLEFYKSTQEAFDRCDDSKRHVYRRVS